jgi:DNA-binding response OmpR family regulator
MDASGCVLLVDDEETFRESTCRLLERRGYRCHTAANGDEAIHSLQERRFDLMVADIRMPGNQDMRVVRAAKELAKEMPVILVTGYPSAETAIRGIDFAVAAYMTKPLDVGKLIEHLQQALEHARGPRTVLAICERLQTCLTDLKRISDQSSPVAENIGAISVGTIRTLAACLSELLEFAGQLGGNFTTRNLCELLDCPQQPVHRQAISETIEVLRQTKDAFKSKALAELREKLERLLSVKDSFHR